MPYKEKNTSKNDNQRPIYVKTASKIKYSLEQPVFCQGIYYPKD